MIYGERVKQARELIGLTQVALAESIGVHPSEIGQIETGRITPGEEVLQRIAFRLGFPISFFKQPVSIEFPLGSLLYRARTAISKRDRCKVYQHSQIFYEVINGFEKHIQNDTPYCLPRLDDTPKDAAILTRSALGLSPDAPINNLVSTLEKNRILVMALPTNMENIDAFSLWVGDEKKRPVIVLVNNFAPGDRLRWSIAHELGHLVLHQVMQGDIANLEKEANAFAGEFLMPGDAAFKELVPPVTLTELMHLKERWKMSIQALMLRALRLEVISSRQYKYLMYQLINRDWKKREPVDIPVEKPRFIGQIAEILYGVPIDYKSIAAHTNLPIQLIRSTIQAHAIRSTLSKKESSDGGSKIINFIKKED
jgi:Zn-dependent peptidase ImmA (M78 family)/DNA-binding XRE family transcriptional regulator